MTATPAKATPETFWEAAPPVGVALAPAVVPEAPLLPEPLPEPLEPEPPEPEPDVDEAVGMPVAVPEPVPVAVAVPETLELSGLVSKVVGQVRLNRGLVDRLSVMANFMVLSGLESRRVYQKLSLIHISEPTRP